MADVESAEVYVNCPECGRVIPVIARIKLGENEVMSGQNMSACVRTPGPERRTEMWVIKEGGINFVYGFDEVHSALIMTTSAREAKQFRSKGDAELWIDQCGRGLESLETLRILESEPNNLKRRWYWRSDKRRQTGNLEGS